MFIRQLLPVLFLTLTALAGWVSPALAHDGEPHGDESWWSVWSFDPAVILLLGLTLVLYGRGWRVMARRQGGASPRLRYQTWAFGLGMAALVIALLSPLDALASQLFWVHMLQHNLLMLVVAPLLVLAYPLPAMLLGLPSGVQRGLGKGWRRSSYLRALWGILSSAPAAWLVQAILLWGWHAPVLYQLSVKNDTVHALQHFSFLGSALLFWWVILHTFRAQRANRGMAILYLFTTAMHSGMLGALLTFSSQLWYPVYSGRSENWGMSALTDQQLAGTIMWVPAGLVYLFAALWLMKTWLEAMEAREMRKSE